MTTSAYVELLDSYTGFDGKGWICDTCSEPIKRARDGWVQWKNRPRELGKMSNVGPKPRPRAYDLQLVHHVPASPLPTKRGELYGCQFEDHNPAYMISDLPLTSFLGANGMMRLLSYLSSGKIVRKEVMEMFKRLHIPGYEHARMHFDAAIADGVFEPNTREGFYWQNDIEAVNKWAVKNSD